MAHSKRVTLTEQELALILHNTQQILNSTSKVTDDTYTAMALVAKLEKLLGKFSAQATQPLDYATSPEPEQSEEGARIEALLVKALKEELTPEESEEYYNLTGTRM